MMRAKRVVGWGLAPVLLLAAAARPAEAPAADSDAGSDREFLNLHRAIRPQPGESPWMRLPWLTDLHEARKLAARQGKLLLVWNAGGGHPLGFV